MFGLLYLAVAEMGILIGIFVVKNHFYFSPINPTFVRGIPGAYIVTSGSMEPTIKTGGLVFSIPVTSYQTGDVVTFKNSEDGKTLVTHRIEAKVYSSEKQEFLYYTKGDANKEIDGVKIENGQIIGRVVFGLPYLGYAANSAKDPKMFILLVIIPATIIVYEEFKFLKKQIIKRINGFINRLKSKFISIEKNVEDDNGINKFFVIVPVTAVFIILSGITGSFFTDSKISLGNTFTTGAFPIPPVVADHIVISEVQINGANANQDFVELYNPTDSDVNLSGWQIKKKTSTGTTSSLVLIGNGTNILAHGFFLWANNQGNPSFSTTIGADINNANNISENNSIALENKTNDIIDKVGWGTGINQFVEGTLINNGSDTNKSMERKAYSTSTVESMMSAADVSSGNGYDSDNNAVDFILRTTSQPQNSSITETP